MSPWGDIFTDQLRDDIFIDQQQLGEVTGAVTHKSGLPSETCQIRSQGYQGPGSEGAAEGAGVGSGA